MAVLIERLTGLQAVYNDIALYQAKAKRFMADEAL